MRTGYPISLENRLASSRDLSLSHFGSSIFSWSSSWANLERSSAVSMLSGVVPRIVACSDSPLTRLFAVCPPTLTTTPRGRSLSNMSKTRSRLSSSKYSLSSISKSVDTVSGMQFIIMTSDTLFLRAVAILTQHQSNSTLDPILHLNYVLDLVQKPSVDPAQLRNLVHAHSGFQSFCYVEDSLISGLPELFSDPLDTSSWNSVISQLSPNVEHPDRFLQGFFEASSDRHDFTDGFHLGPDTLADFAELLEVPTRSLDYNVIKRRFETRRSHSSYLVRQFWENVAKGQFCSDVCYRVTCGL